MKWHLKRLKINYSSRVSWSLIGIVIYSSLVSVLGIQSKLICFLLQGIFPGPGVKLMAPAVSPGGTVLYYSATMEAISVCWRYVVKMSNQLMVRLHPALFAVDLPTPAFLDCSLQQTSAHLFCLELCFQETGLR